MTTTDQTTRLAIATRPSPTERLTLVGLLGLPAYGALAFLASLRPQPDPAVDYTAWAQFVTTPHYLLSHLLGSSLGLVCAIFGTFALGAHLSRGRSVRLALTAMVTAGLGNVLFLFMMSLSTFATPAAARANLAGVENIDQLQRNELADRAQLIIFAVLMLLSFVGNILLGLAIWRSGVLPKIAGLLWITAAIAMYALGLVVGVLITHDSPPTEPIGAVLAFSGGGLVAIHAALRHLNRPGRE